MRLKNKAIVILVLWVQLLSGVCPAFALPERACLAPSLNVEQFSSPEMFGKFLLQGQIPYLNSEDAGYMRWIEFGTVADIVPDIVRFRDFHGRQVTQINGLKHNVEMGLPGGRRLFITDDEQQVLPFWWKMRQQNVIKNDSGFLHVDAHLDTRIVQKVNQPIRGKATVREVYDIAFTAQESGFLIPAMASRIIDRKSAYLMDPRRSLLASRLDVDENNSQIQNVSVSYLQIPPIRLKPSLVSVDLDALAGLSRAEAYKALEHLAKLCQDAKAITICTSPVYMIDQEAAIDYAKYLANLLSRQAPGNSITGDYKLLPRTARPTTWDKLFSFLQKHDYIVDTYYHEYNPAYPTGCASFSCLAAEKMEEEALDVYVLWSKYRDHFYLSVPVETRPGFFEEVIIDYTADQTKVVKNSPLIETRARLKERFPETYEKYWPEDSKVMRKQDVLTDNFYLEYVEIWVLAEELKKERELLQASKDPRNPSVQSNVLFPELKKEKYLITIDGPSGAGKSTAAKNLAKALGAETISFGKVYRALTLTALEHDLELPKDIWVLASIIGREGMENILKKDLKPQRREIEETVPVVAPYLRKLVHEFVRGKAAELQALGKSVILEGREAAIVFKDADYRFYLNADLNNRMEYKLKHLIDQGEIKLTEKEVFEQLFTRDRLDRAQVSALGQPDYTQVLDISEKSQIQTRECLLNAIYLGETAKAKSVDRSFFPEITIFQAI